MTLDDGIQFEPEVLEEILQKRSDINAEVFALIADQKFQDALGKLEKIAQLDIALEGEIANGTLFKLADANAGLRNWSKAAKYAISLQGQIEHQIAEIESKVQQDETLSEAETINQHTLPQLLAACESRLPLYRDYGERVISLKELLKAKLKNSETTLQETVIDLRIKLFSLTAPGRPETREKTINTLAQKTGVTTSKNDPRYRKIVDIVFSYVIDYVTEHNPENEGFFIDPIFYEDVEPEEERKKLEQVNNPLAWEERLKNRAQKIMQKNKAFIEEHQEAFQALHDELEEVIE